MKPETTKLPPSPFGDFRSYEGRDGVRGVANALQGEDDMSVSATTNILVNTSNPKLEIVANLLACGKTRKEISETLGISYSNAVNISAQPYVKKRVQELLRVHGGSVVENLLKSQLAQSVEVVIEIRDDPNEKGSTRLQAANSLLDRILGKPTQHIKTEKVTDIDEAAKTMAEVQSEISKIETSLQAKGALPNSSPVHRLASPLSSLPS